MKKSNRDHRSGRAGGGRKFRGTDGEKRSFADKDDHRRFGERDTGRPVKMHRTTCSACGEECEVPFKPTGEKPVFCSNCFGGKSGLPRTSGRDAEKHHFQEKRMYPAFCAACGNTCEVPFRPAGGKPIYCSNCFRKGDKTGGRGAEQFEEQFEIVNAKLDTILKLLTPAVAAEVDVEEKPARKVRAPKTKKAVSSKKAPKKKTAAKKTAAKKVTKKK